MVCVIRGGRPHARLPMGLESRRLTPLPRDANLSLRYLSQHAQADSCSIGWFNFSLHMHLRVHRFLLER